MLLELNALEIDPLEEALKYLDGGDQVTQTHIALAAF